MKRYTCVYMHKVQRKKQSGHAWQGGTFEKYFQKHYVQKLAATVICGCKMFWCCLWNLAYIWTPSTEIINISQHRETYGWTTAYRGGGEPENWHHGVLAVTMGSAQAAHDTVLSTYLILCLVIKEVIGAEWTMSAVPALKAWESRKPRYYTCSVNGPEIITSSWPFCSAFSVRKEIYKHNKAMKTSPGIFQWMSVWLC